MIKFDFLAIDRICHDLGGEIDVLCFGLGLSLRTLRVGTLWNHLVILVISPIDGS